MQNADLGREFGPKDPALERRFQPVIVPEPSEEEAREHHETSCVHAVHDKHARNSYHKASVVFT